MISISEIKNINIEVRLDGDLLTSSGDSQKNLEREHLAALVSQLLDSWILEFEEMYYSQHKGGQDGQSSEEQPNQSCDLLASIERGASQ